MKKVWWIIRITVIVTASYCIFAPNGAYMFRSAQAQEDAAKCDTNIPCGRNTENNCYCSSVVIGGPAAMAAMCRAEAPDAALVAVDQTEIINQH